MINRYNLNSQSISDLLHRKSLEEVDYNSDLELDSELVDSMYFKLENVINNIRRKRLLIKLYKNIRKLRELDTNYIETPKIKPLEVGETQKAQVTNVKRSDWTGRGVTLDYGNDKIYLIDEDN